MAGITADAADDVGGVVLLLRAVILAMADLSAVLAGLVLVVTQGSVQGSELTQLIPLEFVLALGDGGGLGGLVSTHRSGKGGEGGGAYRLDHVMDQLLRLVNLLLCVGHNETVQVLFLVAGMGSVGAALALLDGALATNGNLGAGFRLHLLEGVATGADE